MYFIAALRFKTEKLSSLLTVVRMWSSLEFAECTVAPRSEGASWCVAVSTS